MTQKTRYQLWIIGLVLPFTATLLLALFAFLQMIAMPDTAATTMWGFGSLIIAALGLLAWIVFWYSQLVFRWMELRHQQHQKEMVEHQLLTQSLEQARIELNKSNEAIAVNAKEIEKLEAALNKARQQFNLQTLQQLVEVIQSELKKQSV